MDIVFYERDTILPDERTPGQPFMRFSPDIHADYSVISTMDRLIGWSESGLWPLLMALDRIGEEYMAHLVLPIPKCQKTYRIVNNPSVVITDLPIMRRLDRNGVPVVIDASSGPGIKSLVNVVWRSKDDWLTHFLLCPDRIRGHYLSHGLEKRSEQWESFFIDRLSKAAIG